MITDKRFFRFAMLFVAGMMLLCSCSSQTSEDALLYLETLDKQIEQNYAIVIPQSCGSKLSTAADKLSEAISDKTGDDCRVYFDNSDIIPKENCFTVLLGNTNRYESSNAMYFLKRDDYICKPLENVLVLGGKSDDATALAVEKYVSEVLALCEPTKIIFDDCGFEYRHEYEVTKLCLCGFDFENYSFVYNDTGEGSVKQLVYMFREYVANVSGYYPNISSKGKSVEGKREIIFTADSAESYSKIRFDGEDIYVSADSVYGLSVASEGLYRAMFENVENGVATADITYQRTYTYSVTEIGFAACVLNFHDGIYGVESASQLASNLNLRASSIAICGIIDNEFQETLRMGVDDRFAFECIRLTEDRSLSVMIDKNEFSYQTKTVPSANHESTARFTLTSNESGDELDVLVFCNISADDADVVRQTLQNIKGQYIAFCISDELDNFDVFGDGITTEYNSVISDYRLSIFISDDNLDCSEVVSNTTDMENVCFVSANINKRFCDEFVALSGS